MARPAPHRPPEANLTQPLVSYNKWPGACLNEWLRAGRLVLITAGDTRAVEARESCVHADVVVTAIRVNGTAGRRRGRRRQAVVEFPGGVPAHEARGAFGDGVVGAGGEAEGAAADASVIWDWTTGQVRAEADEAGAASLEFGGAAVRWGVGDSAAVWRRAGGGGGCWQQSACCDAECHERSPHLQSSVVLSRQVAKNGCSCLSQMAS